MYFTINSSGLIFDDTNVVGLNSNSLPISIDPQSIGVNINFSFKGQAYQGNITDINSDLDCFFNKEPNIGYCNLNSNVCGTAFKHSKKITKFNTEYVLVDIESGISSFNPFNPYNYDVVYSVKFDDSGNLFCKILFKK